MKAAKPQTKELRGTASGERGMPYDPVIPETATVDEWVRGVFRQWDNVVTIIECVRKKLKSGNIFLVPTENQRDEIENAFAHARQFVTNAEECLDGLRDAIKGRKSA